MDTPPPPPPPPPPVIEAKELHKIWVKQKDGPIYPGKALFRLETGEYLLFDVDGDKIIFEAHQVESYSGLSKGTAPVCKLDDTGTWRCDVEKE